MRRNVTITGFLHNYVSSNLRRRSCYFRDISCEARVTDGLKLIVHVIHENYVMGVDKVDLFRGGPVALWFRQEKAVPKALAEDLTVVLGELMGIYGARELMNSGVVNYGTLAAMFEVTVPGIGDE